MVRRGLATFIKAFPDLALAGEANSGERAIEVCREVNPDVVLMDLLMPGMGGVKTTRVIVSEFPNVRVLVLTSFKDADLIHDALQAGAAGYLLKNMEAEELANAIRLAYSGQTALSQEAAEALVQAKKADAGHGIELTEREQQVLELMVSGLSNTEIARQLYVSPSTIKTHVSNILLKLGATSRTEAVALALRLNLIS
jgi:NarL family two-component system response regulator LiaR